MSYSIAATAQVNVYTRSYDNARTGANLQETVLTPTNVNATNFGKLFTVHTDGQIYAQPLYVSNLSIAGGTHNVVFVASMLNTVYALDADTGATLWTQNFGSPIIPQDVEYGQNIAYATRLGILGTPVIDPATNYMYFVSGSQPANGTRTFAYNLNAIDITTGLPVHGSPIQINATYSTADLTAPLVFNAQMHNPRPGIALANGNVYIAFASHSDAPPYHGWVLAYSTSTLAQTAVYSDTTIGTLGGIWNAGQAPSIDAAGNIYMSTGNGSFGKTANGLAQTGNSFIKLSPTLQLLDYFTPYNSATMNVGDMDLGSSGVLLIPNTSYVLGGGKQGVLYLTDSNGMGGFNTSSDQVRQEFQAVYGNGTSHIHGGPVYFNSDQNGPTTYVWGENDVLREFLFNATTGLLNTTPLATSTMTAPVTNNNSAMPGGFLSISASGNQNGILWASTPFNDDAAVKTVQGVLYAFNADTLALLWSDKTNDARDEIGYFAKYVPPVVANGKMYIASFGPVGTADGSGALVCYGLLQPELTVNVANATMTAGAALPTLTGTVLGLANGDTLGTTINVTYSTTATSASPAGTYPITATVTGTSANNYQVVVNAGTLTISPPAAVTLTVAANNATRVYGAANPTFSGTVTGAQNGDTFTETYSTAATSNSNVGSYPIVPAATGANLANYTVSVVDGTLTVTQASQTITFPAVATHAYGSAPFAVTATSSAGSKYPVTVTVQSGPATISGGIVTITGTGTVALQAAQAGDANYSATTAGQSFQVTPAALTVSANNATRAYGAANPAFSGTVTGAVGSDSFSETFTTPATAGSNVGSYPIVPAVSGPQSNYTVSMVNGALTVTGAATTTTLSAPGTAGYGTNVTLMATVASNAGTPAGSVTFYSGAVALGTTGLNGSGVASLSTTTLPVGADNITATYTAAGNFAGSTSAAAAITVNTSSQIITFAPIASRPYGSAPFAVTATSSLGSSYPVTITVQSGPAVISGGMVSLTGVGAVVLQASQAGDANHAAVTTTQGFQVTPAPLKVAANNATRAYGAANPAFSGTVTGALGSDSFTESFTTTAIAASNAGSYPIVPAVTGPQSNYTVTIVNGTLTVTGAATTTSLSAPASAAYGASVTLTATVASTAGVPGGSVTFYNGTTSLGTGTLNSSGVATLSTTTLPAGSDIITASYAAGGNFAASTSVAEPVSIPAAPVGTPGSYTVSASPTSLAIKMGAAGSTTLTFTPAGGYSGTIALSCTNLPSDASCVFAQNTVALSGNNKPVSMGLTIQTTAQTAGNRSGTSLNPALLALAFWWPGGLSGLALFARKRKLLQSNRPALLGVFVLCTLGVAAGLAGCGMSGYVANTPSPSTSQVNVVATGTSGTTVTTQTVTLTLNLTN